MIEGIIKEKQQAKEEYKDSMKEGKKAAYAEINEETGDIMKVLSGNLKPSTSIEIVFSYLQQLEVVRNKFYRFAFHSTITPRYHPRNATSIDLKSSLTNDPVLLSQYPRLPAKQGYF